jgi:predicted nucleotidyltransferase
VLRVLHLLHPAPAATWVDAFPPEGRLIRAATTARPPCAPGVRLERRLPASLARVTVLAMRTSPSETASALVLRHRREREAHERRAAELRRGVAREAAALIEKGLAVRAWLIGSLAWGTFGERSDVDIVCEGLTRDAIAFTAAELGERLCARVDVLRIEDLPESFRVRVLREGIPLVP